MSDVYEIELILPELTSERGSYLFTNVTKLQNRDTSRIDINVDFLAKFINLAEFNGRLLLSKSSDLQQISTLNYQFLILDLNHLITDSTCLDELIRPNSTLILRNLAGAGSANLKIRQGYAEFLVDLNLSHNIIPWLSLLASENIHQLNTKYCDEDFLSKLPPNIENLHIAESLSHQFEPAHPVNLIGKISSWHSSMISKNITKMVLPLRQNPEEILTHNPHLNQIGYYPDLEHISMFSLIDKINNLLQKWPVDLNIWVPSRVNQIFLQEKISNQRVHILIANW